MRNRYKVVWYHRDVVFAHPYARSMRAARTTALELLETTLPIVKPLGAWILRRRVQKVRGVEFIDWVPVETIGKVPA